VKLNVGCGNHYAEGGWVNLDRHDLPHHDHRPDLMANVLEGIPLEDNSCEQVFASHFLEHIPWASVPDVVAECWRVLAPGGRIAVVGPCLEFAIRTRQPMWLLEQIVGDPTPETPGLGHEWAPTGLMTLEAVRRVIGLAAVLVDVKTISPPEWPNPSLAPWQFAIRATKP
jgi:predicted SAM-dependent methyltransferase